MFSFVLIIIAEAITRLFNVYFCAYNYKSGHSEIIRCFFPNELIGYPTFISVLLYLITAAH